MLPVPAEVLRHARDAEHLSQTVLAGRLGTVASVLSKLERTGDAEPEIAERYLKAIGSSLAEEVLTYYARDWGAERAPSFLHPDRETLWLVTQALRELDAFEQERGDPILRGPIDLQRHQLRDAGVYIRGRDHVIAWVGDIGVGKTTALTHAAGLLVGDGRSGRRPAFPVGSGRTTVCETAARVAPTYGVLVDPYEDEAIIRLSRDLVSSLQPGAAGVGVPAEIGRLLRTMAKMSTVTRMVEDEAVTDDPIADLLNGGLGIDEVTDRVVSAMRLANRKERQILLAEGSDDGLLWVSKVVSAINAGTDARFSLPARITVLMPSKDLSADGQILSVVDNRGVENVTQRKDLTEYNENDRALVVLCTKFANAPDATVQRYLQDSVSDGSNATTLHRRCILVLPRGDEALEVAGAEPAASRAFGYSMRRKEVRQALVAGGLPEVPVHFFDARQDDAEKIWASLRGQIAQMRAVYAERAQAAARAVSDLIANVDDVRAQQARLDVQREVIRLLGDVGDLGRRVRPAHQNLVDQIALAHHSSVAASISRKGCWSTFQFAHILGTGVRIDANLRSRESFDRIRHKLMDLESKYGDLNGVLEMLNALKLRLDDGLQDFLSIARAIGADAYGDLLSDHSDVWAEAENRYDGGVGYKRDVASIWRDWFEQTSAVRDTEDAVDERLQDAWEVRVLEPLAEATRLEEEGASA